MLTSLLMVLLLQNTTAAPTSDPKVVPDTSAPARAGVRKVSDSEKLDEIRRDVATLKASRSKRFTDPEVILPFLTSMLIAVGGWLFVWKVTRHTSDAARRQKDEDRVFESLKLLSEGSQARGIALGLIEAYWDEMPRFQQPWATVVANQAIHLLTQSKERDSYVELDNLHRIFRLLERRDVPTKKATYQRLLTPIQRSGLREAMRLAAHPEKLERGVRVDYKFAGLWYLRLWGIPESKIDAYLEGDKSVFDINGDIDEHAFTEI